MKIVVLQDDLGGCFFAAHIADELSGFAQLCGLFAGVDDQLTFDNAKGGDVRPVVVTGQWYRTIQE